MATTFKTEPKIYVGIGLDFETGALDCIRGGCTQIAMQAVRLDTMKMIDRYVSYIYPYEKQKLGGQSKRKVLKTRHEIEGGNELMDYEPEALEYSGITMEMLFDQGVDCKKVATDIIEFARRNTFSKGAACKPVLVGQNIPFDIGFLQQLMNYAGLLKEFEKLFAGHKDFYGNFQPHYIDTIDIARLIFAGDPTFTSYKLEIVCDRLGIDLDDAHDADADVTATLNVIRVGTQRLRNQTGDVDSIIEKKDKSRVHFLI